MRFRVLSYLILVGLSLSSFAQTKDPHNAKIVTSDIDNFWLAFDAVDSDFKPQIFQKLYLDKGSHGLKDFIDGRIRSAENLVKVISKRPKYYASIRRSTQRIHEFEGTIKEIFVKMKDLYPEAVFPPVYFVIGAMNSGGTSSKHGLIIGAEMYGLTDDTPMDELSDWHKTVIKSVDNIPHIVAHELVHDFQKYDEGTLLAACIKEGGADYIAELISGKHINDHVHEFANPREKELWLEFKERMLKKDYDGWLYTPSPGRPNDLGYWMGYQITKSYFDHSDDKRKAFKEYLDIKDFEEFLKNSRYEEKFD